MTQPDHIQINTGENIVFSNNYYYDAWIDPAPADNNVKVLPTIYASDPPAVVDFLTHVDSVVPGHTRFCDDGDLEFMCAECRTAADAAKCRHCDGSGIYSDEIISRACPYCDATGEGDVA